MRFRVIFHTFLGDFRQDFLLFCNWRTFCNNRPWLHNNTKVATWPKKQSKCQKPWKMELFRKSFRKFCHRKSHHYMHLKKNEEKLVFVNVNNFHAKNIDFSALSEKSNVDFWILAPKMYFFEEKYYFLIFEFWRQKKINIFGVKNSN